MLKTNDPRCRAESVKHYSAIRVLGNTLLVVPEDRPDLPSTVIQCRPGCLHRVYPIVPPADRALLYAALWHRFAVHQLAEPAQLARHILHRDGVSGRSIGVRSSGPISDYALRSEWKEAVYTMLWPSVADRSGLWLATSAEDVSVRQESMRARAEEILRAARGLHKATMATAQPLTGRADQLAELLTAARGARIGGTELQAQLGCSDSSVRSAVSAMRIARWPLCADHDGYWLGDADETWSSLISLGRRALRIREAADSLQGAADAWFEGGLMGAALTASRPHSEGYMEAAKRRVASSAAAKERRSHDRDDERRLAADRVRELTDMMLSGRSTDQIMRERRAAKAFAETGRLTAGSRKYAWAPQR